GGLWLLEDGELVRRSDDEEPSPRVPVTDSAQLLRALTSSAGGRRLRALLDLLGAPQDAFAIPIQVEGRVAGLWVARMTVGAAETRRLAAVLAGQASVLLGQLELVDALDRERRMMNAILRHSPVGVMLEDAGGRIVYANPEIEAIYSLQASEMPGRKPEEIYNAAGAMPVEDEDSDGTLELRMKEPDRTVHVRRVVIPGLEGEPAGVLTLHEDVTAQRHALEAKDLMLRAIGHEVRSPAAAMQNTLAGTTPGLLRAGSPRSGADEPDRQRARVHDRPRAGGSAPGPAPLARGDRRRPRHGPAARDPGDRLREDGPRRAQSLPGRVGPGAL